MMAPVEHTKWMVSTWNCILNHGRVHSASRLTTDCSGVHACLYCRTALAGNLKWPKIKQVTNSKLYYNKFAISVSPFLQSKVALT